MADANPEFSLKEEFANTYTFKEAVSWILPFRYDLESTRVSDQHPKKKSSEEYAEQTLARASRWSARTSVIESVIALEKAANGRKQTKAEARIGKR